MKERFTISIFTEDVVGILNRITTIFTRRKINIESLNVSESEVEDIFRYTIVIIEEKEKVRKVVQQIEKQIDVLAAKFMSEDEITFQEVALYKVNSKMFFAGGGAEQIVRNYGARILSIGELYAVIENTGHEDETLKLFKELEPFGILEFVRSGRIAIAKPMKTLASLVNELKEMSN